MTSKCGKCGRALKDPRSIKRGYGPNCWQKVKLEEAKKKEEQEQEEEI